METKLRNIGHGFVRWTVAMVLALVLLGVPLSVVAAGDSPVPAHHFWGKVMTNDGQLAARVEVAAWINGERCGTITTDGSGQYGSDPLIGLPYYLSVTGQNGDSIEFRVAGIVAEETRLGVLMEVSGDHQWQWQDLMSTWQAVYEAGEVNALDLVYSPSSTTTDGDGTATGGGGDSTTTGGGGGGIEIDATPPVISSVSHCYEGVTETTADICWTTNEPSTSQVEYWAGPSMLSPLDGSYVTTHSIQLTGLTSATTYHYKTMSKDMAGNLAVSLEYTFTTLEAAPTTPATSPEEAAPTTPATPPEEAAPTTPATPSEEAATASTAPVPTATQINWTLLGGIIAGVVIVLLLILFVARPKRRAY
jgi:hypothetical protein